MFAVDIDKVPRPAAIDPQSDPEGAVEYLLGLLPPELQDATCWWQFTASQSLFGNEDTLSARLWFWNETPLSGDELKRWGLAANVRAGLKLIDTSLYSALQAHYVAAPVFSDNIADPLSRRFGLRQGLDDDVVLIIPDPAPKNLTPAAMPSA